MLEDIKNIIELLEKSIKENPENSLTAWEIIADNYDEKVDEYRNLINNSKDWLTSYQAKLAKETGINSLKIKYTNISWYFIEIQKSQLNKVPQYFILKQTLVNASRYFTIELKEFEEKFVEAEKEKSNREYELFLDIREKILNNYWTIKGFAHKVSNIDFLASLAQVAYENNFIKPEISDKYDLKITAWKHPVIMQNASDFISNNLTLTSEKYMHIITWPNMWWKSTFLRQNALIILLSHIWSYVPASEAIIPVTDKIFSRIWANDNLYLWQSTFMVEMQEVANILNNSTKNSFVIIDEVWRWTSTFDGMSLAWAILKENHDKIKAKTLFATHFHELVDESKKLKWVENFSVAVWENNESLVFLRKIIPGGIKKSFWLEVAKVAWLWDSVINEARNMLNLLEKEHNSTFWNQLTLWTQTIIEYRDKESEIENDLKKLDVNNLTPLQALEKLAELRNKL